jgi:Holliday junction resolvase RusA-like endonuclease
MVPTPWARARSNSTHYFNTKRTQDARKLIQVEFLAYKAGLPEDERDQFPLKAETSIRMELTFWFARPKKPKYDYPPKADLDNLTKLVRDALNGLLYEDDRQVWKSSESKKYCAEGGRPGVDIRWTERK